MFKTIKNKIKNKIKKQLCKLSSQYQDGKLVVSGHTVIILSGMGIATAALVGRLIFDALLILYADPIGAIHKASGMLVIGLIVAIIIWEFIKIMPWHILDKIAKQAELTCDRVIFPEEVKTIFAQIEALDEDQKHTFMIGLNPLLRKLGEDV